LILEESGTDLFFARSAKSGASLMKNKSTPLPRKRKMSLPEVIPPRSVVELIKADQTTPAWRNQIGKRYRIGYYNPRHGIECIWLVDNDGVYCETTDREYLLKYFKVIKLSNETDYWGMSRRKLGPIRKATSKIRMSRTGKKKSKRR